MELPLFISTLQNSRSNQLPALAQELLRDLIDAYFSASFEKDKKEMERINALADEIRTKPSKYINSGPADKKFVLNGVITPAHWEKLRSREHTGKTFYKITENEGYKDIVEKVKNRSSAYNAINLVYYLNKEDGARGFGHAAILLVNSEGNGTFYSYASKLSVDLVVGFDVDAQMGKLYMTTDQINRFLDTGRLSGIKDNEGNDYNGDGTDHYSGFILMPFSNKGTHIDMYSKAEEIYKTPGKYNLFENNCNHTVQQILEKGGLDFTPTGGSSIDEQNTMVDLLASNHRISSVFAQLVKDSLDCTVPNSAFILGKLIAIGNDWTSGKLGR